MNLSEVQTIAKSGKKRGHCNRKTVLPYQYEWTCFSSGYNLIKRKHELAKIQRKKMIFINRLKHAEQKIFCICVDVYKIYEGNNFDKIYDASSTIKKLKINKILIEEYKDMLENPDFGQNYWSKTANGINRNEHDGIRTLEWICYYDRSFYKIKIITI